MPAWNYIPDAVTFLKKVTPLTMLNTMKELSIVTEMGGEMEVGTYLSEGQGRLTEEVTFKLRHERKGDNQEEQCSRQREQQGKRPTGGKVSCV